ncbi:RDD family protein [Phycicoccus flavus]|uniref:RDD family protein n=1 Tax=Phycicoccus flavus TaxID=2502783 RepID=UPI000FEBC845|nr:RDD family protein [Phycicoccus flavus]NHA67124.1 RDD family protein [Phycicoccus flavus]
MSPATPDADEPVPDAMSATDRAPAASAEALDPELWRRLLAFLVDWALAVTVTFLVLPYDLVLRPGEEPAMLLGVPESSWAAVGVFFVASSALVALTGSTLGHRLLGLQVWQVRPGLFALQVLVRTALACLFLPGLVRAGDGRLLHDYVAGTRIVRPKAVARDDD